MHENWEKLSSHAIASLILSLADFAFKWPHEQMKSPGLWWDLASYTNCACSASSVVHYICSRTTLSYGQFCPWFRKAKYHNTNTSQSVSAALQCSIAALAGQSVLCLQLLPHWHMRLIEPQNKINWHSAISFFGNLSPIT